VLDLVLEDHGWDDKFGPTNPELNEIYRRRLLDPELNTDYKKKWMSSALRAPESLNLNSEDTIRMMEL
jgi:hypothetical protein